MNQRPTLTLKQVSEEKDDEFLYEISNEKLFFVYIHLVYASSGSLKIIP